MASNDQMDVAAQVAMNELKEMMNSDENLKNQFFVLTDWLQRHYMVAGYKRLCRAMLAIKKES